MLDEQVEWTQQPGLVGIEKQVVAVGRRPIGDRHARIVGRHQTADPNQRPHQTHSQHGQSVQTASEVEDRSLPYSCSDIARLSTSALIPSEKFLRGDRTRNTAASAKGGTRHHPGVTQRHHQANAAASPMIDPIER